MSHKVERLPGEPILLMDLFDSLSLDEVYEAWNECAKLVVNDQGMVYRITDTRKLNVDFGSLVVILADAATSKRPGSPNAREDLSIHEIVVAPAGTLARLGAESLGKQSQYGQMAIEAYDTPEKAIEAARQKIKAGN
jgi:hypothetical protein